ncbi:uncharacterized protein LOC144625360 isoform X2 [Crassostrea virginica]
MACGLGYYGLNCNSICPPGYYGDQCAGLCFPKCSNTTCHHVHGCLESNTEKLEDKISVEHLISTRATTRVINTSDMSSFIDKDYTWCSTRHNETQYNSNRSHLLLGIGIMLSIAIILTMTYLWLLYKDKRRKNSTILANLCL